MNQTEKRKARIPGKSRFFCLSMLLALVGLTGCGRQELEFYTQEELAQESGTQDETYAEIPSVEETARTETTGSSANTEETAAKETTSSSEPAKIFVDVCGAVVNPGVYEMEADSRVFQAIELAGGYLPEAAQSYLNRASRLGDGQQIYVPTQAEIDENPERFGGEAAGLASGGMTPAASDSTPEAAIGQTGGDASDSGKVNLNTADLSELTTLTGIGDSKAQAIIAYREANGGFKTIEDLMKVDGIKEGTYAKIKDRITVG